MIRVYVNHDTVKPDNAFSVMITGHAREDVCAAATALKAAMVNELARIANLYPKQMTVYYTKHPSDKERRR